MKLFYSIKTEDFDIPLHGDVEYPLHTYQVSEEYTASMISYCRNALTKSIEKWGVTGDQIVKTEFYFYKGSEEILIFKWIKKK